MKTLIHWSALLCLAVATPLSAQQLVQRYFPANAGDFKYYNGPGDDLYVEVESGFFDPSYFHVNFYYYRPGTDLEYDPWAYGIFGFSGDTLLEHGIDFGWRRYEWDPSLATLTDQALAAASTRTLQSTLQVPGPDVPASVTIKITPAGAVTVPAGTYYDCRSVTVTAKAQGRTASAQTYILAPRVGQIKIGVYNGALRFIGWQELVSGRVGGVDVRDYANQPPPTLAITSPRAKERVLTEPAVLTGTASDNQAVTAVWCQLNGGAWQLANGTTSWSASLSPVAGPNIARAYALDGQGNSSPVAEVSFTYVMTAPVTIQVNGSGSVAPLANGSLLEVGRKYSLRARPVRGFKFMGWTGTINTNKPVLRFVMQPGFSATANFEPK